MKRPMLVTLTIALLALPVWAEGEEARPERSPEAIAILQKVDAAIKKVDSVSYDAFNEATGALAAQAGPASGQVVMKGWTGTNPEVFWVHVEAEQPGSDQKLSMTAGGNGDLYFLLDHSGKKAYEDMDPAVLGSAGRQLLGFAMVEFVHDRPFDDELNADKVALLGSETVGGEDCHVVDVVYSGGQGHSTWYFSKKDNLPRRRVLYISGPQGDGTLVRTVTNLVVSPEIKDELFVMKLPEGYEQIDDFAP